MTTLTDAQRTQVGAWLREGLQIAEIQNRLASEAGVRLTYLELKLLVSELNVMPKDKEPTASPANLAAPGSPPPSPAKGAPPNRSPASPPPQAPVGKPGVSVTVDSLTRPGAMVSGGVTFGDGKRGTWYVDELGRLSVAPAEAGYRPSPADMQQFQAALEQELARAGF